MNANEQYRRAPAGLCSTEFASFAGLEVGLACAGAGGSAIRLECAPGERALDPLFRRVRSTAAGGWSDWTSVDIGRCVVDADFQAALAAELRRLPLTPSTVSVQPPTGWTLVNADTIVYTDHAPQVLTTTVLGVGVTINATPTSFTWDFNDGAEPLTTTDPGRPWPDYTVSHQFTTEATRHISLTTTWTATYQLAGTPTWEPVTGTATTTSTAAPLQVYEARARLVQDPT
ncbi:hypothetical protein [Pengzhenrongella sicca]|uniref:PKD domain-containing protein n=1 Tax=Pengzhenrongella sicca TaxID=2819238 RepID=A0A8A4ZF16_9MICO|nr:hypothetical protein [Pengzhenrongella sicca]QTE29136.1 hypothetical protein J4E96_17865 [Pengzhenrongella sicca]